MKKTYTEPSVELVMLDVLDIINSGADLGDGLSGDLGVGNDEEPD